MRADFCHLCTGCTLVEDMGRQESPHLIERDRFILMLKKQIELPSIRNSSYMTLLLLHHNHKVCVNYQIKETS